MKSKQKITLKKFDIGATPKGSESLQIFYSTFKTNFGLCLAASTESAICNVLFARSGDRIVDVVDELAIRWPKTKLIKKNHNLHEDVIKFFSNPRTKSSVNKSLVFLVSGTDFQIRVWNALLKIPKGKTFSYAEIARKIGAPNAHRAVGTAIGKNQIAFIVPCHRVLISTGKLGGYRWGTDRKKAMLDSEGVL